VVNAEEDGVDDDGRHNHVLKGLGLDYLEALPSETVDRLDWDDLGISLQE